MTTFPILNRELLEDDEQRSYWDELTRGPRGFYCGGPDSTRVPDLYNAWLQFPELARSMFRISEDVRKRPELPGKLRELIVLVTSAFYGATVEFDFHVPFARTEGLSDELIEALREGRRPPFADEAERIVYEANVQLVREHNLRESTRCEIVELIGYRGLAQFIGTIVVYVATAFTMNISRAKLADDFSADPGELERFFTNRQTRD